MNNKFDFENLLKKNISSKKRIQHSLSTAKFMRKFAGQFDIDEDKAYIAGLLHDIAKEFDQEKTIKLAKSFKKRKLVPINYFDFKLSNPFLLHGVASAEIMYTVCKIKDKDILYSACNHTYGGKNLSKLAKYTFICDYCEPEREYNDSKKINKILIKENNFNKAYLYSYIFSIQEILEKTKYLCQESIDGYNEALKIFKES